MNEPTASLHAPPADLTAFGLTFSRMTAKVRHLVSIKIPIGYQDETGFHLGVELPKKISLPELGARPAELPNQLDPAGPKKPAVLVVQDDPYVSAVLWTLLNHSGFDVVSETSAPVGWELARSLRLDAVVLDVNLPVINGLEICRRLKADPATHGLPVIFCSGQGYVADEAMELGAAGFLDTMSDLTQLPDCLRKVFSAQRPVGDTA